MAIAFRCTGCRHPFSVHDHLAGKRIKCAQCGTSLLVPLESAQSAPVAEVPDGPPPRRRAATPVVAAAPPPPRPPIQASGYPVSDGGASSALAEVAEATATHEIRRRRRRGMPIYGWATMLVGIGACVVLAVIVFKNETLRFRGRTEDNPRRECDKTSLNASSAEQNATATVEPSQPTPPTGNAVDEASTADTPAATTATVATKPNAASAARRHSEMQSIDPLGG